MSTASVLTLVGDLNGVRDSKAAFVTPESIGQVTRQSARDRLFEFPDLQAARVQHQEVELPDAVSDETVALATESPDEGDSLLAKRIHQALKEIIDGSVQASDWHSRRAALYGRLYFAFGLPAAVLATLAAATGLASTAGRVPAAIIALVSAGISAAGAFLDSGGQRKYHQQMSAQWYMVAGQAKLHRLDMDHHDWKPQRSIETLNGLISRQAELLQGRPALVANQSAQMSKD